MREFQLPPSVVTSGRWAFIGLLVWLGVNVIRFSLGDFLSDSNPAFSVAIDASQSGARAALLQALLLQDSSRLGEAVAGARDALSDNPFSPDALELLARENEERNDKAKAADLMTLASRIDLRDLRSQLWLLDRDMRDAR